jgi:hypothetical protein
MARIRVVVLVSLAVLLACRAAWAQGTAQLSGTVKDQSGAVLPGVEVNAMQTATGAKRAAVSDETGSFVLPNLPIGPYLLEAGLTGFKSYVQSGIVLQVGANPLINIVLQVGQVADQIEVQADAALVETRSTGVGQMIDNQRVLELPLNGRQATELIFLAGIATQTTDNSLNSGVRNYPTTVISVAGGANGGLNYFLDGGTHNDPENSLNLPLPFPDALQEFKVETSGVPAQYGHHAAGTVNGVTKSGTNSFHGDVFEFLRNGAMNARNAYSLSNDGLKRNQFGGVIGGPIIKNKLFFFGGEQTTTLRALPSANKQFVPTPQMLAGDFTTFASAQCQGGKDVTLAAPFGTGGFARNTIDPNLFASQALALAARLPKAENGCGLTEFGGVSNTNEYLTTAKVDYQKSEKHSIFARYMGAKRTASWDYDGKNILTSSTGQTNQLTHSLVIGDTYLLGTGMVNALHITALRTINDRIHPQIIDYGDIGVKNIWIPFKGHMRLDVGSGVVNGVNPNGFTISGVNVQPGYYNSVEAEISDDLNVIQGAHQWGTGVIWSHLNFTANSNVNAAPYFQFTGQVKTGLALADFLTGYPSSFRAGTKSELYPRQTYFALYLQDTWKAAPHFTMNYGIRYEPFIAPYDGHGRFNFFSYDLYNSGFVSKTYPKAPVGLLMPGDPGTPPHGKYMFDRWLHFAPRLGVAWDPRGNGLMVVRASYGIFNELPPAWTFFGNGAGVPWNGTSAITNPSFADPWNLPSGSFPNGYPGGNPLPSVFTPNSAFPLSGDYDNIRMHAKSTYIHQWNLSVQRQAGENWLFAANYLGNQDVHLWGPQYQLNYAVFTPTATVGNLPQRRVLTLANPKAGAYYNGIGETEDGGTGSYHAMLISVQRRRAKGLTISGNYTWSHCIGDGVISQPGTSGLTPGLRRFTRGNCGTTSGLQAGAASVSGADRRHVVNLSTVVETPRFANSTLRLVGSGWQLSGIVKLQSGTSFTVSAGTDVTLNGATDNQRALQILADPYMPNKTRDQWLNPAAFVRPANGQYGNAANSIRGPGIFQLDMGLTRKFQIREGQSVEFRAEAFDLPNHVNPNIPSLLLNSQTFGKITSALDPRIMQLALKYVF